MIGFLPVCIGAALWGTVGIASEWLYRIDDISPFDIGFYRLAISSLPLALYCLSKRGMPAFHFPRNRWPVVILLGAAMAFYQIAFFTAVDRAGVTLATLIAICVAPLLVVIFSRIVWAEPITRRITHALVIGLIGTTLIIGFPGHSAGFKGQSLGDGMAWAFAAALSYAIFVLCSRTLAVTHEAFELIAVGFGIGAILLFPLVVGAGHVFVPSSVQSMAGVLFIGLVPTALAYTLYFTGIRRITATSASIVSLIEPFTAAVLAWLIFDERLGYMGILGGVALLVSVSLLARNNG